MRFNKIIFIQLLAVEAGFIKRETSDESLTVYHDGNSTITSTFETTTAKSCDWSWGKRHACAITGFVIGIIGFPMCLCCCGFRSGGVAGGSCAAGIQSCCYGGATGGCFSILQSMGALVCSLMCFGIILCCLGIFGFVGIYLDNKIYTNHCQ